MNEELTPCQPRGLVPQPEPLFLHAALDQQHIHVKPWMEMRMRPALCMVNLEFVVSEHSVQGISNFKIGRAHV